jgi:hypothetical protein
VGKCEKKGKIDVEGLIPDMARRDWTDKGDDFVGHLLVKFEKSVVFSLVKRRSKSKDWMEKSILL